MSLSVETLAVARKYTDDSLAGAGAVAGVPCKIQSITAITGGNRVTFLWTDNNGDDHTSAMDVMNGVDGEDGKGIQSVTVNAQDHLIITYTDGTTVDAGEIEIHNAVDSVNGQTGAVVLDAEDVGALPDNTPIPSKTSDLTNDSGFATTSDVSTALADYTTTADLTTLLAAKQDTLTFDDAPTENSNNPVKSGGVFTSEQDIFEVMGQNGAKNLIPYPYAETTKTQNGVTFTDNGDGTITVNGTASANTLFTISTVLADVLLNDNTTEYILSGCEGGGGATYKLVVDDISDYSIICNQFDNEADFTIASSHHGIRASIVVYSGQVMSNVIFKPMVRLASDTDSTYQPYAKTNQQLTAENQTLMNQANSIVNVLGAKNLLPQTGEASSYHGVDFTVNSDGTVSFSGTITDDSTTYNYAVNEPVPNVWKGNTITFGVFKDIIADVYAGLYVYDSSNTLVAQIDTNGNTHKESSGVIPSNAHHYIVQIVFSNNRAISGTLYPMIRPASIEDDTYVPYSMTNREMTPYVQAISNPNLLDNPWFTVNQRGDSSYTGNGIYTFDRWEISGENTAISKDSSTGILTFSTADTFSSLIQKFPLDYLEVGKTYTLSVMFSDGTIESHTFTTVNGNAPFAQWEHAPSFNALITNEYSNQWQVFIFDDLSSSGATNSVSFKAVKLEVGEVSTLAMDTAPNYATELLKCQRYFNIVKSLNNSYKPIGFGYMDETTSARIAIPLSVPMRTTPTIVISDISKLRIYGEQARDVSAMSVIGIENNIVHLSATVSSSGTKYSPAILADTTKDEYISFSADL